VYYDTATLYSLWSQHSGSHADGTESAAHNQKRAVIAVISYLRKAQATGLFKQPVMLNALKQDKDFNGIRDCVEFHALVTELEREISSPK
jgi:hypothetical protein